jgi:hypothetical protein
MCCVCVCKLVSLFIYSCHTQDPALFSGALASLLNPALFLSFLLSTQNHALFIYYIHVYNKRCEFLDVYNPIFISSMCFGTS